ncbi:PREDICTED: BURP [Prunus dulcis]|uniref:PREDICTED: BURP n=1 Tax=Prunus dulcis TaxID=3755 RepID=A0A5E4EH36_PRUDU|nr:PREDICTED: BURP [Prunus dulcis]
MNGVKTRYCGHGNGARDVQQYQTAYGAAKNVKEVEDSSYGPYITQYNSGHNSREAEVSYPTSYGTKEGRKEAETPYINQYNSGYVSKEVEVSYITNYGTKEDTKEAETPYITQYNSGHSSKEAEVTYITNYGTKEDTKETETPYKMSYETKKGTKEVETPYVMSYGTKEVETPYITGYSSAQGNKESKEIETPYITGFISAQAAKEKTGTKCKHHKHVNPPSSDTKNSQEPPLKGHEHHHMHTHSSSPMDHNEAFKIGFFTFDDLYKGKIMPLNFPKQEHSRFLPKEVADSIPFAMQQLPHLLQLFSIPQGSLDAKHMAYALEQCEMKPITGETKFCATSLESMIEFVTKIIGSGVSFNILSTTHPTTSTAITQSYTILEKPNEVLASKMVFCHPIAYPYAVFFCHNFERDTKFFKVSLEGVNGDKVEAMAVCHMDTSDWDPNHSLFGLLGIKAGASSPVCHFFPENHLAWIPSPTKATM